MPNRVYFTLAALLAVGIVALAMDWPQGLGARSPRPFGHAVAPYDPPKPPAPHQLRDVL